jgi:hypothetical protein
VVVLPLTTKSPHQDGFAEFGRIVVDCFADCDDLSIINLPELIDGIRATISSQRIDIAALITYAGRRGVDLSKIEQGIRASMRWNWSAFSPARISRLPSKAAPACCFCWRIYGGCPLMWTLPARSPAKNWNQFCRRIGQCAY